MSKILFLGAAEFQTPPIRYALSRGYEVITCDYLPDNPGHKLATRSYDASTIDFDAVLKVAQAEQVDGVLTFGSDVSAPTAAYVAEQMGLPGNPLATVQMLTNKALFREFCNESGIQPQPYAAFSAKQKQAAIDYAQSAPKPIVAKPTDASGSKGVGIIASNADVESAIHNAYAASIGKQIVIEKYVQKRGKQVCGDGFVVDGKIAAISFGDGHFYDDGVFMAPYAETFPGMFSAEIYAKVKAKLQAMITASGLKRGAFNHDVIITTDDEPFVFEIGPRSGGNYIPRAIQLNTGVDMVAAAVESALDPDFTLPHPAETSGHYYACYMVHSTVRGVLRAVTFSPEIAKNVYERNWYVPLNEEVWPFSRANAAIGNLILRFGSKTEMNDKMARIRQLVQITVEPIPLGVLA